MALGGCAIAGTWERLPSTDSKDSLPFGFLTLDDRHRFTATSPDGRHTTVGRWEGNASRFVLKPDDSSGSMIRGHRRLDGNIVLRSIAPSGDRRGVYRPIDGAE
jgi:hypothetical protein